MNSHDCAVNTLGKQRSEPGQFISYELWATTAVIPNFNGKCPTSRLFHIGTGRGGFL